MHTHARTHTHTPHTHAHTHAHPPTPAVGVLRHDSIARFMSLLPLVTFFSIPLAILTADSALPFLWL